MDVVLSADLKFRISVLGFEMQDSSIFKILFTLSTGFAKYIEALLKEGWLREAQTGWLVQATDYR